MTIAKNKFGILYVDDEEKSLKYFEEAFGDIAPIFTATSPEEGLDIYRSQIGKIGVVLSDKRMPVMSGIEFLKEIKKIDDHPLRILVTAFADMDTAVEHLNEGLIYSYLTKPWDPVDLKSRLSRALDRFWISNETNRLLKQRSTAFQEMIMAEKAANIQTISKGLNHHMRNSLNVIQAYFDMIPVQLNEEVGAVPKDSFFWGEYYQNVEEQISRVIAILSNLTAWSNTSNGEATDLELEAGINVADIMRQAAEAEIGDHPSYQFKLTDLDRVEGITADKDKLSLMALNLVREARKNISETGTIEVQIFSTPIDGAEGVRVRCIDDGTPIPEHEQHRLFDPFFVRADRPSEVGTDLLFCYLTVFHHGGKIKASSLKDGRNMIEFHLPVIPTKQANQKLPFNEA